MADETPNQQSAAAGRAAHRGKRVAQAIYYVLVGALILAFTVQITRQVFFADEPLAAEPPYASCRDGLQALYDAVERGRRVARETQLKHNDAELALTRYRSEVARVWRHQPDVAALCRTTNDSSLLDALERLRYSEEHGVRHEASELTALRHRVRVMFDHPSSAVK